MSDQATKGTRLAAWVLAGFLAVERDGLVERWKWHRRPGGAGSAAVGRDRRRATTGAGCSGVWRPPWRPWPRRTGARATRWTLG